jgi:hypothetical protein
MRGSNRHLQKAGLMKDRPDRHRACRAAMACDRDAPGGDFWGPPLSCAVRVSAGPSLCAAVLHYRPLGYLMTRGIGSCA